MHLKRYGKLFTIEFARTGLSSYEKRIYRAAASQRLRNTALDDLVWATKHAIPHLTKICPASVDVCKTVLATVVFYLKT